MMLQKRKQRPNSAVLWIAVILMYIVLDYLIRSWRHTHRKWDGTVEDQTTEEHSKLETILQQQVLLQEEFQTLVYENQHPTGRCRKRRILLVETREEPFDGFTLELQMMGRYLEAAVATDRTLVIPASFISAYAPPNCDWKAITRETTTPLEQHASPSWDCLYESISTCSERKSRGKIAQVPTTQMSSRGIMDNEHSLYFSTKYYGSTRLVKIDPLNWIDGNAHIDHIPNWERTMGRFWVRSQLAHYLWKPSKGLRVAMDERMPIIDESFIGMHIRFSDNIGSFEEHFGRDARITRNLIQYMQMADKIRNETGISTIYLATDSQTILEQLDEHKEDWTFVVQDEVERTNATDWVWFADSRSTSAPAIATDVEMLRRADYLIGSFQSNVYRLATELNMAYHMAKYPTSLTRHFSVDIEWYEDP